MQQLREHTTYLPLGGQIVPKCQRWTLSHARDWKFLAGDLRTEMVVCLDDVFTMFD